MTVRMRTVYGLAMAMLLLAVAPTHAFEPGDDQYPNSIMAPEPGTLTRHRAAISARSRHVRAHREQMKSLATRYPRRKLLAVRGSSGSVLPTPLPRTPLIPPEGSGTITTPALPQQQGATVVPGMNPVPNLPHGAETFQDRASRCAHQAGLYGVPNTAVNQYMSACSM